jgi:hypothetical protein
MAAGSRAGKEAGLKKKKERGRERRDLGFFSNSFSKFANFTQTNIKLCIQIMMHKHLLLLKLLK